MSVSLIDEIKQRVHQITNHLQAVLGYIELEDYDKAQVHTKLATDDMHELSKMLSGCSVIVIRAAPVEELTVGSVEDIRKVLQITEDVGQETIVRRHWWSRKR